MVRPQQARLPRRVIEKWLGAIASVGPILAALVAVGGATLYGHAPRDVAANYSPPTNYGVAYQPAEYAAISRPNAGWDLFYVDSRRHAVFQRVSGSGRTFEYRRVASGGESISQPTLAEHGHAIMGAWVKEDNGALTLWAAYLGAHRSAPFRFNRGGGLVEHPYLLPAPGGGFLVLFEWQHPNGFDIYLASLPPGARHPTFLRRLTRSPGYAFYPRGALDGSGALDTVHLELCCRQQTWLVEFQRFSALGTPLGRPKILDSMSQAVTGTPNQWGMDVQRAADGSVWAAWEGEQWVSVARWDDHGRMVLRPSRIFFGNVDLATPSLALVPLQRHRAEVYFASRDALGSHLTGVELDATGRRIRQERVEYGSGGTASYPRAGAVHGRPAVLWEKLANDPATEQPGYAVIEGSVYRPASPSLAAHLGIGIGNAAWNLAMIGLGALLFGALLTMGNLIVLLCLILAWPPIGRLVPQRARWPLYLGFLGAVLAAMFAMPSSPPDFVLFMSGLGRPYGWLAVAGAVFVSYWTGRRYFGHQEPIFRAVAMGIAAFYFVTVMDAATMVQAELGQI